MTFEWIQIPYALLTVFIILNYGMFMTAIMQKIGARVGGRRGIPVWQNYIDLVKNWALRTKITHGVMYYLGPVFRLTGGLGLILFVPTIYGSVMHQNFSYSGDLILALYFIFFGTLGMALGAGESGHPHSAIGVSRGLAQVTAAELPMALAVFSISLQYQTLNITEIVAAQQGGLFNWTVFTNPLAVIAAMFGYVGTMMRSPFDVVLAPQEIPIGPPTEYHSAYLALMQTNRVIFPIAKTIIYMNLFFGGADNWGTFAVKVFALYFVTVFIGVVHPRFRVEQSIRFFLKWGLPVGVLAILMV